jgi:hypothetical protein
MSSLPGLGKAVSMHDLSATPSRASLSEFRE